MDSALSYFHQSKHGYEALQSNSRLAEAYYGLAKTHQLMGQKDSAFHYAEQSVSAAEKSAFPPLTIVRPMELLAELHESTGDYKEALRYNRLSVASKDSLQSKNKMNQLAALMFDERLQQQEAEARKQQYQSRIRTYVLLFALLVFLLVAFFLYRANQQKQEANSLLQEKNTEIDKQRAKAEQTLQELKATQAQLVQREKMASLGELTAGIAHEIQNPLNFVNNFSEMSAEMIEELEAAAGDKDETLGLARDLKVNLQKIHHHGKRAEAIVKNMMEHSHNTSGEKQFTDLNALTEEYLRLAYLGVQLKDKSFTAIIETHYDPAVGQLNVVSKDMGRVLLNLFNNAFYAVNEKKKLLNGRFEPKVSINTKKISDKIEISVQDNGIGIPEKLMDKIFQPFFTTKPTGEGTGLGLSLSYDIVTKGHLGEMRVASKEGEGAEFIVQLPA
jgi:signal transduction histidine kinase